MLTLDPTLAIVGITDLYNALTWPRDLLPGAWIVDPNRSELA